MLRSLICCIAAAVFAAEENLRSTYSIIRENKRFAGEIVEKRDSPSLVSCGQTCLRYSWCTSTNFEEANERTSRGNCELIKHDFSSINDDTKLTEKPGTTFTNFFKGCLMKGCLNGGSCYLDKEKVNFACSCKLPWSGERCELGSCEAVPTSGIYQLKVKSIQFEVFCDVTAQGKPWTLIARFSNSDNKNWMQGDTLWWYDQNVAMGVTTDPSVNADMISPAFWLVSGREFKITRSDDPSHTALLQTTGNCLGGQTFRSKITSYGNFRNVKVWSKNICLGNCTVQYGGQYKTTDGFQQAKCSGFLQSSNKIGFWCSSEFRSRIDGSVMMIGGGGRGCTTADHGIGITKIHVTNKYDFGFSAYPNRPPSQSYSLNLWIR